MRYMRLENADIFEQEPTRRTLTTAYNKVHHFLPFPYIVYIIRETKVDKDMVDTVNRTKYKTLHVGFRTEPIKESSEILHEELILPPLPNFYSKWLMVCSKPSINYFWNSSFNNDSAWVGCRLLTKLPLKSYSNWEKMSIYDVMEVFENAPDVIKFPHFENTGLWHGGYSINDEKIEETKVKLTLADVLKPIPQNYQALFHISQNINEF